MRGVIDTNVLISAALKDKEPEAVILCVVSRPDLEWIASPEILREYKHDNYLRYAVQETVV